MKDFKNIARKILPKSLIHPLGTAFRNSTAAIKYLHWKYSIEGYHNQIALNEYRNIHLGERCFIIGNGPSLNKMDLSPLANEITFGLNRIYLLFDKIGFNTTYYVAINRLVLEQFWSEIEKLTMPKFVRWEYRSYFSKPRKLLYIRRLKPSFSSDIRDGAWGGATVTYAALQIAFYMGFQQVFLIGVDHSFKTKGTPHQEVISEKDDPNHFVPNYFGKGTRWHLPDLETSESAYRKAKEQFLANGRQIFDATVGGKLDVFPKVDYQLALKTPPIKIDQD
jgi:hypothetical protein